MLQPDERARLDGQYALVSYIPGPLARFLDELRLELTPGCNPHAHVTVLPPRPLECGEDPEATIEKLADDCRETAPFTVELGAVEIFPQSNVVYMEIARGGEELQRLYRALNCGSLEFRECFPYHPHMTIAQWLTADEAPAQAAKARERWAAWTGERTFEVKAMTLVRNVGPTTWEDLAELPLGTEVPVGG